MRTPSSKTSVRPFMARVSRIRHRPRLEVLEDRQLLAGVGPFQFEFGAASTQVDVGAVKVVATPYDAARGYGWNGAGGIAAVDRGSGAGSPTSHFNYGRDKTFLLDLANGVYDVTPTLGDSQGGIDGVSLWINGQQVGSNLNSPAGQAIQPSYRVRVSSGRLALRLADLGGENPNFAIDSLRVTAPRLRNGRWASVPPSSSTPGVISRVTKGPASRSAARRREGPRPTLMPGTSATAAPAAARFAHARLSGQRQLRRQADRDRREGTQVQPSLRRHDQERGTHGPGDRAAYGYTGSSLSFSASATDPSSVDTAAGFTYAWNFGDGATGTGASPSHTYTSAGTYTVSVTATDKDGGTSTAATKSTRHRHTLDRLRGEQLHRQ